MALSFVAIAVLAGWRALRATGPRVPDAVSRASDGVDRAPDGAATRVEVAADGRVSVAPPRRSAVALCTLTDGATRAALRAALADGGSSRGAPVAVVAAPGVPWAAVLEVVGIARAGGCRTVRLARTDAPDDGVWTTVAPGLGFPDVVGGAWTLPLGWVRVGWVAAGGGEATATLEVRFVVVDVPIDDVGAFPADLDALPWRTAWAVRADVRGLVAAARRRGERVEHAVLDVPPPLRNRVTFGSVFEVLHGVADAGLESIAPRDG